MHSLTTRNEFLHLRAGGLSLARIGRQLGVSKPTLIKWSRRCQPQTASPLPGHQYLDDQVSAATGQHLAQLNRQLTAVKQELFSRAVRDLTTPDLETLLGELRQRIENLAPHKTGSHAPAPPIENPNQTEPNWTKPDQTGLF